MKFVVSSKALYSQLQAIGRVVSPKNSLAILDCFLFNVEDNQLKVTASDSETTLTASLELIESNENGCFAINSKKVLEALKDISEQPLTFQLDLNTMEMTISYQNGYYNLIAQKGEDYPQPIGLSEEGIVHLNVKSSVLLNSVTRTLFATSDDTLRPVMNGIYFDITTEDLTIVATDGHKLVRCRNFSTKSEQKASFVLPKKPAQMLKSLIGKDDSEVQIQFDGRNATFKSDGFKMVCRLIEGRFPNYNSVIPSDNPFVVTINRQSFISALKRVLVFAAEEIWLVKISLSQNELTVSSKDLDFSTAAEEHLACSYNGRNISIGFKGTFLIDILNNLSSEDVMLELADAARSGVIVPADQDEDEDTLMLLMPMMLND
ncbi:MAG: DNA polymerase III subunit beta [Bacteroidaceae bacterium]|nr:DNA polymerase III subunit beta [Bacteroidaceae bacterium]